MSSVAGRKRRVLRYTLSKKSEQAIDRDSARDLAGSMATHSIANDKDSMADVIAKIVFVVGADASHIRSGRNLNGKWHIDSEYGCFSWLRWPIP